MATFSLKVRLDNDAFQPDPSDELARLLHGLASDFAEEGVAREGTLLDINGNSVGTYSLTGRG